MEGTPLSPHPRNALLQTKKSFSSVYILGESRTFAGDYEKIIV